MGCSATSTSVIFHIFFVALSPLLSYKEGMPLTNISWLTAAE